jgi:hypothetical protein
MGTLLVHAVGESDLHLSAKPPRGDAKGDWEAARCVRVGDRLAQLASLLPQDGRPAGELVELTRLLTEGGWDDDAESTDATVGPLFAALDATEGEVDVVLVGTKQKPAGPLDTWRIANRLAEALDAGAARRIVRTHVVTIRGLAETPVAEGLGKYLRGRDVRPGDGTTALVTWGSGSTSLAMGCLTALSQAGIAWRLVVGSEADAGATVVDPLDHLGVDPVAALLVRWRMFGVLESLAGQDRPTVRLSPDQRDLVRRSAQRSRDGLVNQDTAGLRAVVADAVVRRDGTAGLAVRRYIEAHYRELLEKDRVKAPEAKDLLKWIAAKYPKKKTLGARIGQIRKSGIDKTSPSARWLLGPDACALNTIGKASHELRPPEVEVAARVGKHLQKQDQEHGVDESGWAENGLPVPPVVPTHTVLAVWGLGNSPKKGQPSVADQLAGEVPVPVQKHFAGETAPVGLRALVFGTVGEGGSLGQAQADVGRLNQSGLTRAWAQGVDRNDISVDQLEEQIEARLVPEVGALLLVPTGLKPLTLRLVRAMRRIGAHHGLPLFVREMDGPGRSESAAPGVHLWPALTGGDLALLEAAREALEGLELDVAWRLLAGSAIPPADVEDARLLADAFGCRPPFLSGGPSHGAAVGGRALRMAAQRLAMVRDACDQSADMADRVRFLALAGGALEVSASGEGRKSSTDKNAYTCYREALEAEASGAETGRGRKASSRVLLLLNEARDGASITHGPAGDGDQAVAAAVDSLAATWCLSDAEASALPRDVRGLLRAAAESAESLYSGLADPGDLNLQLTLSKLRTSINTALARRQAHGHPSGNATD